MDGWAVWDGESRPVAREPPGKTGLCPWGWGSRHRRVSGTWQDSLRVQMAPEGVGSVRISLGLWMAVFRKMEAQCVQKVNTVLGTVSTISLE